MLKSYYQKTEDESLSELEIRQVFVCFFDLKASYSKQEYPQP